MRLQPNKLIIQKCLRGQHVVFLKNLDKLIDCWHEHHFQLNSLDSGSQFLLLKEGLAYP